jgi:hypothetical protein
MRLSWGDYRFSNGRIHALPGFVPDGTINALVENITDAARSVVFENARFTADASLTNIDKVYHDANSTPTDTRGVRFRRCHFAIGRAFTANLRSGQYVFEDCIHDYDGVTQATAGAIAQGGAWNAVGVANSIQLRNNRLTAAAAYLWTPPVSGNPISIESQNPAIPGRSIGFTRYDLIAAPHGPGTLWQFKALDEWFESADLVLTGDFPTGGKWVKGQSGIYADAAAHGARGWVTTVSGNGDGTSATGATSGAAWKKYGAIVP